MNCTSKDTNIIKHITYTENGPVRQLSVLSIGSAGDGEKGRSAMDDLHAAMNSLGLTSQTAAEAACPDPEEICKTMPLLAAPQHDAEPKDGEPLAWTPEQLAKLEAMAAEADAEDRELDAQGLPTRVPREVWDQRGNALQGQVKEE